MIQHQVQAQGIGDNHELDFVDEKLLTNQFFFDSILTQCSLKTTLRRFSFKVHFPRFVVKYYRFL